MGDKRAYRAAAREEKAALPGAEGPCEDCLWHGCEGPKGGCGCKCHKRPFSPSGQAAAHFANGWVSAASGLPDDDSDVYAAIAWTHSPGVRKYVIHDCAYYEGGKGSGQKIFTDCEGEEFEAKEVDYWIYKYRLAEQLPEPGAASPTGGAEPTKDEVRDQYGFGTAPELTVGAGPTRCCEAGNFGEPHDCRKANPAGAERSAEQVAKELWPIWCRERNEYHHTLRDWPIEFAEYVAAHVTKGLQAADIKRAQDISQLTVERDEARERLEQAKNRNTALGLEVDAWRLSGKHFSEAVGLTQQHTQEAYVARIEQLKAAEAQLATALEALRKLIADEEPNGYPLWLNRAIHACKVCDSEDLCGLHHKMAGRDFTDCGEEIDEFMAALAPAKDPQ